MAARVYAIAVAPSVPTRRIAVRSDVGQEGSQPPVAAENSSAVPNPSGPGGHVADQEQDQQ